MNDLESRILAKTKPRGTCLIFLAAKSRGYGVLRVSGKNLLVHRFACELRHGPPTAARYHALHTCNVKACVNPLHLYWGNDSDNAKDRVAAGVARGGTPHITSCVNGHKYTEDNTYRTHKGRHCRTCRREAVRRYREKKSQ